MKVGYEITNVIKYHTSRQNLRGGGSFAWVRLMYG